MKNHQKQEKILKKTWEIDIESEDVVVLDESRAQTNTQTTRCLFSPTINGFKDPNIIYKTEKRFGTNAVGFQGINCPSHVYFNQKK